MISPLSSNEYPARTRFLYRSQGSNVVKEDRVLEWSGSKLFVRLKGLGWISSKDASTLVILEILDNPLDNPDSLKEMCPNCVTPWKCNGPHKI